MAIQATSEEQLRLKKRARQRLLGAATLLFGAAIILPLVLDQAPRPLSSDIAITMPGSSPNVAPKPVAPPISVTPVPSVAASTEAAPVTKPESAIGIEPTPAVMAQPDQNVAPKAVLEPFSDHKPKESKSKDSKPATTEKPTPVSPAKPVIAKETPAATHSPADPAVTTRHYVVQLGAFSSAENVRQLRERLNAVGVISYTENMKGGATRVRVGPFAERDQADKVLAKINAAGVQAQIVSLAPE